MDKIKESLIAIQNYNPEKNVYLRVVAEGNNQRLEAVKMNWFGRLCMWCGCSSGSMTKVAKFLEQNMQALCSAGVVNIQDDKNPLGTLVGRVIKYDREHPMKIFHARCRIESAYNVARTLAAPNSYPIIQPAPVPKFVTPPPTPAKPTLPTPPPSPPRVLTVQESVDCFKAARGHIAKAADTILNKHSYSNTPNSKNAAEEMGKIQQLLKDCSKDPACFAAVIKEMTPDEVGDYAALGISTSLILYGDDMEKICQDIFEIKKGQRFAPSPMFKLAVTHMSVDQLKRFIWSIDKCWDILNGDNKETFYTLAELIRQLRSPAEQQVLIAEMAKQPQYKKSLLFQTFTVWKNPSKDAQFILDTMLAEAYICYLLRDPDVKKTTNPEKRSKLISEFVRTTHFDVAEVACNSPLQNMTFLKMLSAQEQDELAEDIIREAHRAKALTDSILIKDIVLNDPSRAAILFPAAISTCIKIKEFCSQLRQSKPACDAHYILNLLQGSNRDKLKDYITTGLPDANSALEDPNFVNRLTPQQQAYLVGVIFEATAALRNPLDPKDLNRFYVIREKAMKDPSWPSRVISTLKGSRP